MFDLNICKKICGTYWYVPLKQKNQILGRNNVQTYQARAWTLITNYNINAKYNAIIYYIRRFWPLHVYVACFSKDLQFNRVWYRKLDVGMPSSGNRVDIAFCCSHTEEEGRLFHRHPISDWRSSNIGTGCWNRYTAHRLHQPGPAILIA